MDITSNGYLYPLSVADILYMLQLSFIPLWRTMSSLKRQLLLSTLMQCNLGLGVEKDIAFLYLHSKSGALPSRYK